MGVCSNSVHEILDSQLPAFRYIGKFCLLPFVGSFNSNSDSPRKQKLFLPETGEKLRFKEQESDVSYAEVAYNLVSWTLNNRKTSNFIVLHFLECFKNKFITSDANDLDNVLFIETRKVQSKHPSQKLTICSSYRSSHLICRHEGKS